MSRDIYPSLSGAAATWRQLEVLSNNIANADTAGFKAHRTRFDNVLAGKADGLLADGYVQADHSVQDFSDGALHHDGVSTHLALQGRGFFSVESPLLAGDPVLMRAGAFQIDAQGFLATPDGERVLGQSGPIQLAQEGDTPGALSITADGVVLVGGEEQDRLRIVDGDDLEPVGGSRWRAPGGVRDAVGTTIVQGALEGSNMDPMRGMTELIQTSRYFEMYQKAMQTSDELDRRNLAMVQKA